MRNMVIETLNKQIEILFNLLITGMEEWEILFFPYEQTKN